jgi:hypothetical protein
MTLVRQATRAQAHEAKQKGRKNHPKANAYKRTYVYVLEIWLKTNGQKPGVVNDVSDRSDIAEFC